MQEKRTTSNGVSVYSYRLPHLHSFCLRLYLRAGNLYGEEFPGISHFWEHIVFKNLDRLYGGRLYERLDSLGAVLDACTYREFIYFSITAAPKHFAACAEMLVSVLFPLLIGSAEVDRERLRIKGEIRENDEKNSLQHLAGNTVWSGTPLNGMIAGTQEEVDRIRLKQLRAEACRLCGTGRLFFYLTGQFAPGHVDGLCERIEALDLAQTGTEYRNLAPVPQGFCRRDVQVVVKNAGYCSTELHFDIPRIDAAAHPRMDLLYSLLFSGEASRLFMELSERSGLVYSIHATLEKYSNIGNLYCAYEIRQALLYESLRIFVQVLRSAKTEIDGRDLAKVLPAYVDNAEMLLDEPEELNWTMAYESVILEQGFSSIEEYRARYQSVTPGGLMETAGEIFRPENCVAAFQGRKKDLDVERVRELLLRL